MRMHHATGTLDPNGTRPSPHTVAPVAEGHERDAHRPAVLRTDLKRWLYRIECPCGWIGDRYTSAGLAWSSHDHHVGTASQQETTTET
jgi:hypothetical protein